MDYIATNTGFEKQPRFAVFFGGKLYHLVIKHLTLKKLCARKNLGAMPQEHDHAVYHVVLYLSGENRFSFKGARLKIRPGLLVVSSPGDTHDFGPVDTGEISYAELTFSLEGNAAPLRASLSEVLLQCSGLNGENIEKTVNLDAVKINLFKDALLALLDSLKDEDEVLGCLVSTEAICRILRVIVEAFRPSDVNSISIPKNLVLRKVKNHIDKSFQRHLSLGELANIASLSEAYLCRSFKKAYSMTPIEYLVHTRVQAAKALLRTSSLSCKEIALRTGFSDAMFFSKIFKRTTGLTPREYRVS
ncbi:MAG: hypothetical protein A2X49_07630 [Lentisphaerae bacterium GWF2_52_8]|nr:MAG: hypothetical protein A2X49_07630 [Lentisphaerae bacterium GWF2_52_8]